MKSKFFVVTLAALFAVLLGTASAEAASFSGSNGWITYSHTSSSGGFPPSFTTVIKGIKPDASTATLASSIKGNPSWSADGSKIAWVDNGALSVSSPTGENVVTVLTSSAVQSGTGSGISNAPSISADGSKVAFSANCSIYVVSAQAGRSVSSSDKVVAKAAGFGDCPSNPSYSSNGAIAYTNMKNCGGSAYPTVWVLTNPVPGTPSDGTELTTTCNAGSNRDMVRGAPAWSPDGTKIIYATDTSSAADHIYQVLPNNTGKTSLYATTSDAVALANSPAYSPDGTKIVFAEGSQYGACCTIKIMNADGTGATATAVSSDGATSEVTWGPDVNITPGGGGNSGGASSASASATTTTSTTPAPGPALKVADIPAQITVTIAPTPSGDTQEISADVPCTAPEGQTLERCSVKMTAPEAVLLGQGDGIQVRSDKKVTIGQATVKSKSGKKVIVVKVKINQKGRKALKINTKITATIGLTAVTVSNLKSTGSTTSEMRLPTQLLSPEAGIFSSNSIELNKAGIAFVSRLAALLPKTPKAITCIGFADNTGVPGDNRWLGDRRAKAVCNALEAKGIDAVKTSIETKAATSPRADNSTATGRERNRRVSIRITY